MIKKLIALSEKGLVPDIFIRIGIRHLLSKRIEDLISDDQHRNVTNKNKFIHNMWIYIIKINWKNLSKFINYF